MGRMAGKAARWHASDAIAEAVRALGWQVTLQDEQTVIASGGTVRMRARIDADLLEFGVAADFDRWANSTDMTFAVRTYDPAEIGEALRLAAWVVGQGVRRTSWTGSIDLRDHLARYRASVRAAA